MMSSLRRRIERFHRDTRGTMSVEKVMLLAFVAMPLLVLLMLFTRSVTSWFKDQVDQLPH